MDPFKSTHDIGIVLDRPKSQILALQEELIRIFADLKSLCMTLASCKNASEQSELYTILIKCVSENIILRLSS